MCSLGLSVGFITKLPPLLRTRQILLQMRPLTGRCRVFFSLETIVLCGIPVKEFAVHKTCFSCSLIQAHKLSWQGAKIYKFYKLQISTMMRWTNKKITNPSQLACTFLQNGLNNRNTNTNATKLWTFPTQTVNSVTFHPCDNIFEENRKLLSNSLHLPSEEAVASDNPPFICKIFVSLHLDPQDIKTRNLSSMISLLFKRIKMVSKFQSLCSRILL